VLDDGWFVNRSDDSAGLGDWTPDPHKYPLGLTPLIEYVSKLGMRFGLWVEPEMVNTDSDLYRQHPDWILDISSYQQISGRHQYILDLTRREVSEYLFAMLAALLRHNNIDYLKWDMNRSANLAAAAAPDISGFGGIPPELGTPSEFTLQDFGQSEGPQTGAIGLNALQDVEFDLHIELGRTEMMVEEVLTLQEGSVVPLDKLAGDPVDIIANGRLVARGEVLVLNDNFCVRVAEILSPNF